VYVQTLWLSIHGLQPVTNARSADPPTVFTVIKKTVYPAEICVDFDQSQWVGYLATDAIFLYSTLYTTKAFFDYLRQGAFGPDTMKYLGVSLALLRDKLADSDAQPSNGTIASVVSLALMADKFGDFDSAEKHVRGLFQMVHLRGGIESFQSNPQLQLKICRYAVSNPMFSSLGTV
jgi:hypothetical protein